MTMERRKPFRRRFGSDDTLVFRELVEGLVGERCVQVRETYAEGIVADFGQLVCLKPPTLRGPGSLQGRWVVSSWGCDILVARPGAADLGDSRKDFATLLAGAQSLVGETVVDLVLRSTDLSLSLIFQSGARLIFEADPSVADMDQWDIQMPDDLAVIAEGDGHWRLEESPRVSG